MASAAPTAPAPAPAPGLAPAPAATCGDFMDPIEDYTTTPCSTPRSPLPSAPSRAYTYLLATLSAHVPREPLLHMGRLARDQKVERVLGRKYRGRYELILPHMAYSMARDGLAMTDAMVLYHHTAQKGLTTKWQ